MSRSQNLSWNDAHFCGLRSQTNVYSLAKSTSRENRTKLSATSIDGHLATVEFENQSSVEKLVPITSDEVLFPIVLNGNNPESEEETEVVSMDVVPNWDHQGGNVLALTYLKIVLFEDDKAPQAFMNIYRLSETEGCCVKAPESLIQQMRLEFIPFKLSHHQLPVGHGRLERMLLLSGSDQKIHCYQPMDDYEGYEEVVNSSQFFPEMTAIDDNVTQLEIKQVNDFHRLTALGTQNGLICLFLVNEESREILESWTTEMDSPITSLHFFHQHTNTQRPDFLRTKFPQDDSERVPADAEDGEMPDKEALHLLATSAIDPSVVYYDVVANGLSKCRVLPVSNSQDVVLCSCVMDVDFDGENEVLIGTYGQILMVYKLIYEKPQMLTSTPFHTPMPVPIHSDTPILSSDKESKLVKQDETENPSDKVVKEKDVRRRHKTVAATCSGPESSFLSLQERCKEESSHLDVSPHHNLLSRLFRSQENLTSPSTKSIHFETPDKMLTPDLTIPNFAVMPVTDYPCYKLIWTRRFCNPLMGLACDDVMGDGMMDLIVLTLKGLHILQPDLHEVAKVILNRLTQLCNSDKEAGPNCEENSSSHDNQD